VTELAGEPVRLVGGAVEMAIAADVQHGVVRIAFAEPTT
jgi:hypothetical protein